MNGLLLSEIVRVSLAYVVIFYSGIPFVAKVLLVYVLDSFDCSLSLYGKQNCFNIEYIVYDKIGDTLTYGFVLKKYLELSTDSERIKRYVTLLYLWRVIGTLLFLATKDKMMFVYFPNIFFESVVLLTVAQSVNFKDSNTIVYLLSLVALGKIGFEYFFHIKRGELRGLTSIIQ